ncbi:MAG: DUF6125 family protein [Promethearchaeota archaeon]
MIETLLDQLEKHELKELLVKCWMTHDGAWFYNCGREFGVDTANKLNKAAIKNLSTIEMQRIKKAMGWEKVKIETFEQIKEFIINGFSILKGDFMDFEYSFPENNRMHWEMNQCFAYKGMQMFGFSKQYECGVIYRVSCWLDALGIKHKIEPEIDKCLLNSREICSGDIIISL